MKIESKTLDTFLTKVLLKGGATIQEGVLRFEADGLKFTSMDGTGVTRVAGWLKKENFKDYEAIGNIGLNQLPTFLKIVKRFDKTIELKKQGNLLTIKSNNKKLDIELVSEEFLKTEVPNPKLEDFKDTFQMPASVIKDVFKDAELNSDAVIQIESVEKKVAFTVVGDYKFRTEYDAPTCKGGVSSKFGQPLIEALSTLDGMLEISAGKNYPIKAVETTEESVISVITAPRVEPEEQEDEEETTEETPEEVTEEKEE
jgi:hypothetical protein